MAFSLEDGSRVQRYRSFYTPKRSARRHVRPYPGHLETTTTTMRRITSTTTQKVTFSAQNAGEVSPENELATT